MGKRIITMTLRRRSTPVKATFLTSFEDADLQYAYGKATATLGFDFLHQFQEGDTLSLRYCRNLEALLGPHNPVFARLAVDALGRYAFSAAGIVSVFEAIIQAMTSDLEGSFEIIPHRPFDFVEVFGSEYANICYGITHPPKVGEVSHCN